MALGCRNIKLLSYSEYWYYPTDYDENKFKNVLILEEGGFV